MKIKFISESKSFYGFCLIKVYKFTFRNYKVHSLFTDPLFLGRVLLGILGGGVPPSSPIPEPISEQKI